MSTRFRLSTAFLLPSLAALAPAVGAQVVIVKAEQKISTSFAGFGGVLDPNDFFGSAVASPGDLDGDGIEDLAVGAVGDDDGGSGLGGVWILFLNTDGTLKSEQKISATAGGFEGNLLPGDAFGGSLASLGDLDGDGVGDLAVGAFGDDGGGLNQGAVWILFLNGDGTVRLEQKISATAGGFEGDLLPGDAFGGSVASLGDLDGDGVGDLAVGAYGDDDGGAEEQGAVWILFLNADGTVKAEQKISAEAGGFADSLDPLDLFGYSVACPGDLDGDGRQDLAVGARWDDDGAPNQGAIWILFLNADGTVQSEQKISATAGGFGGDLDPFEGFGGSCASLGDLDHDGIGDLAVGVPEDSDGTSEAGALWLLFLNADGTVKATQKISKTTGGFGGDVLERFGTSVVSLGDLDGDGVVDLGVGSAGYGGDDHGAVWAVLLGECVRLDFETEDDFVVPLVNGQHLDTEFGRLASLTSVGPNAGLCIFDSTVGGPNDPSQDRDLLIGSGNILVLQTENYPPDANDIFPRPNDDEDGGTITFSFTTRVEAASLRLIDQDSGDETATLVLTDTSARERVYTIPRNWTGDLLSSQPGQGVVDLTTLAPQAGFGSTATATEDAGFAPESVVQLVVHLAGSGGLDDLSFHPAGMAHAFATNRNGSGANPEILTSICAPVLGLTWSAALDCSAYGSGRATLVVRRRASSGTLTPFGEVLIAGALVSVKTRTFSTAASAFTWDVPNDMALLGLDLHVQGACQEGASTGGKARRLHGGLSNGLDLVLGF